MLSVTVGTSKAGAVTIVGSVSVVEVALLPSGLKKPASVVDEEDVVAEESTPIGETLGLDLVLVVDSSSDDELECAATVMVTCSVFFHDHVTVWVTVDE